LPILKFNELNSTRNLPEQKRCRQPNKRNEATGTTRAGAIWQHEVHPRQNEALARADQSNCGTRGRGNKQAELGLEAVAAEVRYINWEERKEEKGNILHQA
jgi:hypothetical protein